MMIFWTLKMSQSSQWPHSLPTSCCWNSTLTSNSSDLPSLSATQLETMPPTTGSSNSHPHPSRKLKWMLRLETREMRLKWLLLKIRRGRGQIIISLEEEMTTPSSLHQTLPQGLRGEDQEGATGGSRSVCHKTTAPHTRTSFRPSRTRCWGL